MKKRGPRCKRDIHTLQLFKDYLHQLKLLKKTPLTVSFLKKMEEGSNYLFTRQTVNGRSLTVTLLEEYLQLGLLASFHNLKTYQVHKWLLAVKQ